MFFLAFCLSTMQFLRLKQSRCTRMLSNIKLMLVGKSKNILAKLPYSAQPKPLTKTSTTLIASYAVPFHIQQVKNSYESADCLPNLFKMESCQTFLGGTYSYISKSLQKLLRRWAIITGKTECWCSC